MSNMSYCKFQNTVRDFKDCLDGLEEELSVKEKRASDRLYKLAKQYVENYEAINDID